MAQRQPAEYDDQSVPVVIARLAGKVDSLIEGQNEIKESLRTQFQTKEQAVSDKREVLDIVNQIKKSQDDGFKLINDREKDRSTSRERWQNAALTVAGGLALALLIAFLKIAGPSL